MYPFCHSIPCRRFGRPLLEFPATNNALFGQTCEETALYGGCRFCAGNCLTRDRPKPGLSLTNCTHPSDGDEIGIKAHLLKKLVLPVEEGEKRGIDREGGEGEKVGKGS